MQILPNHTEEYFKERDPLLNEYLKKVNGPFNKYLNGEYSRVQYVELTKNAWKEYCNKLTPIWEKYGAVNT